jgi:hypothetical protein
MSCDCADQCPNSTFCMCVFTYDDGVCNCECTGPITIGADKPKLSLYARVDVSVREVDLVNLGVFLDKFCDAELFIPALKGNTKVSFTIKDLTLGKVVENAGLLIGSGKQQGAS